MRFYPELLWFALAGTLPALVAGYLLYRRESRASLYYAMVLIAEVIWIIGQAAELSIVGLESKLYLDGLQYFPACLIPAGMIAFAYEYADTRRPTWLLPIYFITTIPLAAFLSTSVLHGLARGDAVIVTGKPFDVLTYSFSIIDYLLAIVMLAGAFISIGVLFRHLSGVHRSYVTSAAPVFAGVTLPTFAIIIGLALHVQILGQRDLSFSVFGISAILVAWGIYKKGTFSLSPVARDAVFEHIPDAALVLDEHSLIVDINRASCELLSISTAKAIGVFAGELELAGRRLFDDITATSDGQRTRLPEADGVIRELTVHEFDEHGRRIVFIRDITDQYRAQQLLEAHRLQLQERVEEGSRKLEESERKLRAIFDQAFQFFGLLSPDGTVLEANRTSLENVSATSTEIIGRPFWETPWWNHSGESQAQIRDAIGRAREGEFVRFESIYPGANGKLYRIDFSLTPIRDANGRVIFLIPEGRDITALRETEQQLQQAQKMEALGRLAGGVAHDFNNLLTVIVGSTSLLSLSNRDPKSESLLQQIDEAANVATSLTRQLLAFCRKSVVRPSIVDVQEALERFQKMARRVFPENIAIDVEAAPGLRRVVFDDAQLQQTLLNLGVNARDAMPNGGFLKLVATNASKAHPDRPHEELNWVKIDVRDSGIGMTDQQMERIFDPFFTTKGSGRGSGLGLAMVYGALGQNGGFVSVDSFPGAGSTFSLFLPCTEDDVVEEIQQKNRISAESKCKSLIYVVEDNELVSAIVTQALKQHGFQVQVFNSPNTILSKLDVLSRPDLLLTDFLMPQMSGFDLVQRLNARWTNLPIIYMSGYAEDERLQRLVAEGAFLLAKPFLPADLIAAVTVVLAKHDVTRSEVQRQLVIENQSKFNYRDGTN